MELPTIYGKTFADLSRPKLVAGYLVPFLAVAWFFGLALSENDLAEPGTTVAEQEAALYAAFMPVAFFWAVGIPVLVVAGILSANTLAREAERGSLRMLLSKPVSRWKFLLGTYASVVTYTGLVALANVLLAASLLVEMSDVSPAAVEGGIVEPLAGNLLFALFGACVVAAVGLCLAVFTRNRLQTALGALVVPALYFAFFPIRLLSGAVYDDYALYLLDVNYHFGNAFVYVHEAVGGEFDVRTQAGLAIWTGVYELPEEGAEELPASLEPVGNVSMEASVALLALLAVACLAAALYRFQRMDV